MANEFAEGLEQLGWKAPLAGLVGLLVSMIYLGIWSPHRLYAFYKKQNVPGPKYWPLIGNSIEIRSLRTKHGICRRQPPHPADVALQNVPHLSHWSKMYGSVFTFMEDVRVSLCVLDTEMVREVLVSKADCYRKSSARWFNPNLHATASLRPTQSHTCRLMDMMGHREPQRWSTLRKILVPGAHDQQTVQDLQGGLQKIMDHCNGLVRRWKVLLDETRVGDGCMDVDSTRDIVRISMHILFTNLIGSTLSGRDWEMIDSLVNSEKDELMSATTPIANTHFCGFRSNKDDRLNQLLTETVEARFRASKGDAAGQQEPGDFLDLMVASCYRRGPKEDVRQLVEDCKMMVAAQRSTTLLVNNTLLLLAQHTDWQVQARAEVLHVQPFTYVMSEDEREIAIYPSLANLKILNMIVNESLRLSPPIMFIEKICQKTAPSWKVQSSSWNVCPDSYSCSPP